MACFQIESCLLWRALCDGTNVRDLIIILCHTCKILTLRFQQALSHMGRSSSRKPQFALWIVPKAFLPARLLEAIPGLALPVSCQRHCYYWWLLETRTIAIVNDKRCILWKTWSIRCGKWRRQCCSHCTCAVCDSAHFAHWANLISGRRLRISEQVVGSSIYQGERPSILLYAE